MKNVIGPIIGAAIDRRDGDSGVKGAIAGSLIQSAVRASLGIATTFAVGWAAKKLLTKSSKGARA